MTENKLRLLKTLVKQFHTSSRKQWNSIPSYPELDVDYLCNPNNITKIEENIALRKGVGDINLANQLKHKLESTDPHSIDYGPIKQQLYEELVRIPNRTHPQVLKLGDELDIIKTVNSKPEFNFKPLQFYEITKRLNLIRTDQLGNVAGNRSYYLLGEMAELEQSLIDFFTTKLIQHDFQLMSVPDILPRDIVEACGMNTKGIRNQVYTLDPNLHEPDLCLSGTSEMALAGYLLNKTLSFDELPLKMLAVSRCFRAETSSTAEERGIYRVHEFTKVEKFVVCAPEKSDETLEEIRSLQEEHFASLGIHFQVINMPAHELGAQAYRKYDIEAWLPGRGIFGEISSCSNCTDYQSRRLGIKYRKANGDLDFVHTLNGTACAIPRLLIALTETGQNRNGTISIPEVLHDFMNGKNCIGRQKSMPELKLIKYRK